MRSLKVYGWIGMRRGWGQSREILAARSKAEVARIAGVRDPRRLWNLCETHNPSELAAALARPGILLWRGLDDRPTEPWRTKESDT